ncbi:MAG: hypothetical protein GY827_12715 [Cytophagales bacterium]|nr:hypothetical protein [Cytophagales bacterium]
MKKLTIIGLVVAIAGLSACNQGWYDGKTHKTSYKKPITHKVKPHQKKPKN